NHRLALDDAILIKDNHLVLRGGRVADAVRAARAAHPRLPLEVECRTLGEVEDALAAAPDLILLDNMSLAQLAEAVRLVAGRVPCGSRSARSAVSGTGSRRGTRRGTRSRGRPTGSGPRSSRRTSPGAGATSAGSRRPTRPSASPASSGARAPRRGPSSSPRR